MRFKINDSVETKYGAGVIAAIEEFKGEIRYGIRHEIFTCEKPPKDFLIYLNASELKKLS